MIGPDASDMSMEARVETVGIYCPGTDRLFPTSELPLARAMRGETADGVELFIRNAEKPEGQYLSVNVRPLKDEAGAPHGGVAVVRDITVAKRSEELLRNAKEEAERANRAKSEFLSRMSHELRTPLNSILGFAQLLEIGRLEEDQRDSVDQILRGGQHLLSLINEVLDLARIEAGRLSLSPEPVNSREAIQETIDLVYPLAQERGLTIVSDEIDEADCSVHADRQRLRQILLNLLSNAVKYNVENGGIRIRCERGSEGFLRISIVDTGIGIAPKDQQKLFQPFERVVDENRGIEGTGLGLALSKKLTESMGGSIGVQSSVGQGSTFWLELPVADKIADPAPLEDELLPSAAASRPRTVLYVEDNSANFALMERIVARKSEVKLLRAAQGRLAMDLARAHRPDLVLLDLHLPDISGRDVLAALKEDDATKQIPVAVVSADATPGQIDRLLAAGAKSYITKPLDVRVILRLLDEVFRDLP
jgi:signal transduction histidine kinase/ActR/RegA family two-component response regulator